MLEKRVEDTKAGLLAILRDDVEEWNKINLDGDSKKAATKSLEIDDDIVALKKACKVEAFSKLKNTDDPMRAAVENPYYTTYRVKDSKDPDTGIITKEIKDSEVFLKLLDLDKFCGGIGKDPNWKNVATKFHYAMIVKACKDADMPDARIKEVKDCYAFKDIVKQTELPGANPTSNRSLKNTLQHVINLMLGEDVSTFDDDHPILKVTNHDVQYMYDGYKIRDKKSTNKTKIVNKKDFIEIILCICHNRIYGINYESSCGDVKKKKEK